MNQASDNTVTNDFETEYEHFEEVRIATQGAFLGSRFHMLEEAWVASETELDLDVWLLRTPGLHQKSGEAHFWAHTRPYRSMGDSGLWNILFGDGFRGSGRDKFVEAFNDLLESKGMRARLGDNGVQMYFIDVSRHQPRF